MLKIPVTASDIAGWIRLAANAVNGLITSLASIETRVTDLEAFETSATASISSLGTRATALETYTHGTFTLTPGALPGSPVKGMTAYDSTDDTVKTWNGTIWKSHY